MSVRRCLCAAAAALVFGGSHPADGDPESGAGQRRTAVTADDLLVVDCLLPPRVRRLGRRSTFLAPRQPVKTTAVDCRIRGGEYTEPDQATLATALRVWLPQAEAGDAEAQYYVGQLFERGLGVEPDYDGAASWYRKAAEQDYTPAQISLGSLYEEGRGVEADGVEALAWYRRAAGLAEDLVVLGQTEYDELVTARGELEESRREVESLIREIDELRRQLDELETEAEGGRERQVALQSVVERLVEQLEQERREVTRHQERIAALEQSVGAGPVAAAGAAVRSDLRFGRYYALVIGNTSYSSLPMIDTAANDAREVARLLEERYGFEVRLMIDATRYETMSALNELRESMTPEHNLLVYYAGHGRHDQGGGTAYWQPVDAEPGSPANWIPSEVITEHLDLVPARHVLVVADSTYSGLRTRSSIGRLPEGMTDEQRFHYIRMMLERRSRLVLTSGSPQPVPDVADTGHSRFSSALLDVLRENREILEATRVYRRLNDRLGGSDERSGGRAPELATMRWARNDIADFFFVPES